MDDHTYTHTDNEINEFLVKLNLSVSIFNRHRQENSFLFLFLLSLGQMATDMKLCLALLLTPYRMFCSLKCVFCAYTFSFI